LKLLGNTTAPRIIRTRAFVTICISWIGLIGPCHSRLTLLWSHWRCRERHGKPAWLLSPRSLESIRTDSSAIPDLEALAQLLYLTAGITRHRKYPSGDIHFRAAACTGALYEVELYVVCGNLVDLEAGVYHFSPAEFALRRLRAGDYRSVLSEATASETSVVHAPLTIICTCTYWRNAWKYQARTYRHFGWDNGTLLANMLAVATALGMPAKVICGFQDADVNRLLDVDPDREVAFSLVALGHFAGLTQQLPSELSAIDLESVPLSRNETVYPAMHEIHAASSLRSAGGG